MNTTTLIEKLCMADGISGREEQVREQIIQVLTDTVTGKWTQEEIFSATKRETNRQRKKL